VTASTSALWYVSGADSRAGSVRLTSSDPQDVPEINFRFFEKEGDEDLQELAEGAEGADLLCRTWQAAGPEVLPFDEKHPCPGTGAGNCTISLEKTLLKTQAYSHHASSTCAIGADDDPMAVLDSKFRSCRCFGFSYCVRSVSGVADNHAFGKSCAGYPG